MIIVKKDVGYFESFDGTSIYYETRGEGETTIIFAYGLACIINHFHHQINYLSKNFRTVAFDYRGHQKSDSPKDPSQLTLHALTKDLLALMEHLQIKKAHFVGHSFGVQVLLKSYSLFPERFSSMIFINGFASKPSKNIFGTNVVEPSIDLLHEVYKLAPTTLAKLWRLSVNNPIAFGLAALAGGFNIKLTQTKDIEIYAQGVGALDINVFCAFLKELLQYDGGPFLKKISLPTLIISGQKDGVTPEKYQHFLSEQIKGSEFLSVPYGSHCSQLDFPELINLRIEKFVLDCLSSEN